MSKYATGKHSKAISDRSGLEFPYREMVREWNGSFVHYTEFEPKQPQLEPKPMGGDGVALLNVRPDRTEPATTVRIVDNGFETYAAGSGIINVFSPGHGLTDSTNASKDMHFYYIKRIQDVGDYTNATEMPMRLVPCMTAGLAFYLAQKYQPQLTQQMKLYYEDEFARALAEDGSASSTYITPKAYYPGT